MLALCDQPLLTDVFPPTAPQNVDARLLRHGLAVTSFSSLEKYVESRFFELFLRMETSAISYASFDDDLKTFLTRDAASGLLNRVFFLEDALRQSYFDAEILRVAGYQSTPIKYSPLGFHPRGSNVNHEDIRKAFAALGLKDPWGKLRAITVDIGAAPLSLLDDYKSAAKRRHTSAHEPSSNVPTTDLKNHVESIILIGIAVDVLCSAVGEAYASAPTMADLKTRLSALTHAYRFIDHRIDPDQTRFVERSSLLGKAVKVYQSEDVAIAGAKGRRKPAHVIVRSPTSAPLALT